MVQLLGPQSVLMELGLHPESHLQPEATTSKDQKAQLCKWLPRPTHVPFCAEGEKCKQMRSRGR